MKKHCTYVYRIMTEDCTGALCNSMLCLNFATAVAAFLKFKTPLPELSVRVLRYKIRGAFAFWYQFEDFTSIVVRYCETKNLLNYEQGKVKKDC